MQPLEILTTRQWYITNGARDPALRTALLAARAGTVLASPSTCAAGTRTGSPG